MHVQKNITLYMHVLQDLRLRYKREECSGIRQRHWAGPRSHIVAAAQSFPIGPQ